METKIIKTPLDQDIKNKKIYRREVCDRCAAYAYERIENLGEHGYVEYEDRGFCTVVVVGYGKTVPRRDFCLCCFCAAKLNEALDLFLKNRDLIDAKEETGDS